MKKKHYKISNNPFSSHLKVIKCFQFCKSLIIFCLFYVIVILKDKYKFHYNNNMKSTSSVFIAYSVYSFKHKQSQMYDVNKYYY